MDINHNFLEKCCFKQLQYLHQWFSRPKIYLKQLVICPAICGDLRSPTFLAFLLNKNEICQDLQIFQFLHFRNFFENFWNWLTILMHLDFQHKHFRSFPIKVWTKLLKIHCEKTVFIRAFSYRLSTNPLWYPIMLYVYC